MNNSINLFDRSKLVTFNNACGGILQKSHPMSKFVRFHNNSKLADWLFSDYPRINQERKEENKAIVLQIMVNDEWIFAEILESAYFPKGGKNGI